MYVYSRVYLVILIFVICIDKINVYALPVWRLIKDIYSTSRSWEIPYDCNVSSSSKLLPYVTFGTDGHLSDIVIR